MKHNRKALLLIILLIFSMMYAWHYHSENMMFYTPSYQKEDISDLLRKDTLSQKDYEKIYKQTGVSPYSAKELIENRDFEVLEKLNGFYFQKPETVKNYIAYPITLEERNVSQKTPIVPLKKGDIIITFSTRTLDWRHGHCGLVLDEESGRLLEHMSIGNLSSETGLNHWGTYPAFVVLRHPDEKVAEKAAAYAEENLIEIPYNILAGAIKKDKTGEDGFSSHCSHIIWQAYKSVGVDIDSNKGIFVTPKDISVSEELEVIQIYGINPKNYVTRIKE